MLKYTAIIVVSLWVTTYASSQGFLDVSISSGTSVVHDGNQTIDMQIGSGAAWLDYDKDAKLDLYVSMRTGPNKLFRNLGSGNFQEVAQSLGAADPSGDGGGVAIADFNNDGWPDIYLANCQGDKLLKNNGGTSFTDITSTAFIDPFVGGPSRTPSASWGDYNGDGFLDLYIAQHAPSPIHDPPLGATIQGFLYYNTGQETFVDVSSLLGIPNLMSWGFIGAWTDIDHDDDLDIFLVNDCRGWSSPISLPTKIFRNNGGTNPLNWSFAEVSQSVGVSDCRNGMGIAVGDYNRDGWMDVFYTNIGPCVLYKNNHGIFEDVSEECQVTPYQGIESLFSWGCAFMDYDLDGWQDISVMLGALTGTALGSDSPNYLFENNGNGTFTEIAEQLGMAFPQKSRNGIYGDYDTDGDLDLYIVNYGDTCKLMRNELNNSRHWLQIDLVGKTCNRDGIGSKIQITTPNSVSQYYETRSGSNLGGGDSPYAHFGLDTQSLISEVKVKWPCGRLQSLYNVAVDQTLLIIEDTSVHVTKVWEGAIDTLWSNPDNWSFSTLPKVADYVLIPANRPHYPKLGTGLLSVGSTVSNPNFVCGGLHIAQDAQLTTGVNTSIANHGDIVIAGSLTVLKQSSPGIINHPGSDIRIGPTGLLHVNQ